MQRWMGILRTAASVAAVAVGTAAAGEPVDDFLVLGADPDDFHPLSEAASSGALFFVGGSTRLADPLGDAAIVGLEASDGTEVWRASEGEIDVPESFSAVGVAGGRVCAAGTRSPDLLGLSSLEREVLVACYRARGGERLWVRRIELDPTRGTLLGPGLSVSEHAVVVTLSSFSRFLSQENLVLRFDPRDGTGR